MRVQTLNSIQTLVGQCPALATLQHDLEETNFQSATTIPIYTSLLAAAYETGGGDCNANASLKTADANGENGSIQLRQHESSPNNGSVNATAIDSTA